MRKLLLRWVLLAAAVVLTSLVMEALGLGFKAEYGSVGQIVNLLIGVAILSFANATLGRILKALTIPLNCLTFGLFSLVVNAVILWLVATLQFGFSITAESFGGRFFAAAIASLLISICNGLLRSFFPDDKNDD